MNAGFLDDQQLHQLTGWHRKSLQIEWLRGAGVPFRVNATGHPVVTWAAVEGRQQEAAQPERKTGWSPRVIAGGA
jgi:hypothetical protein